MARCKKAAPFSHPSLLIAPQRNYPTVRLLFICVFHTTLRSKSEYNACMDVNPQHILMSSSLINCITVNYFDYQHLLLYASYATRLYE
jgi:hypothetical protein